MYPAFAQSLITGSSERYPNFSDEALETGVRAQSVEVWIDAQESDPRRAFLHAMFEAIESGAGPLHLESLQAHGEPMPRPVSAAEIVEVAA